MRKPRPRPTRPVFDLTPTRPGASRPGATIRPLDGILDGVLGPHAGFDQLGDFLGDLPRDPDGTSGSGSGTIITRFKDFDGPEIKPELVLDMVDAIIDLDTLPTRGSLDALSTAILDKLADDAPGVLPREPLAEGAKGARLPLPDKVMTPLLARAAMEMQDGAPRVLWDDGINQLIVDLQGITATLAPRRITVRIPVACDQAKTSMTVPFATGGEGRNAGMVLATTDRPIGDDRIARLWGESLIALARGAVLSVVGAMAGASGRDDRNERLAPRALLVDDGLLLVETVAQRRYRRTLE